MEQNHKQNKPYTNEELKQVLALVHTLQKIRQRLINDGIPIDYYERLFILGEKE